MKETLGLICGSGRSPGAGNGNPLQHSCLENPIDRGAWQAEVHGVAKRRTRLHFAENNFSPFQSQLRGVFLYPVISQVWPSLQVPYFAP